MRVQKELPAESLTWMISRARVLLTRGDRTNAAGVVSALDHALHADLELALLLDLARLQVHEDRVVRLDVRIREPNRAAVMRRDVRVAPRAKLVRHHAAQLVRSLVLVNLVNDE